jgi:NADPH:quinone reductase-like Zn-dependent oxidoreductase
MTAPEARHPRGLNAERRRARAPGRANVNAVPSPDVLDRIADLLADGRVKLPIAATYDLADASTALAELGVTHTQGKLAIRLR